jgi:exodeoxyribonuclease VII large subunit
MTTEKTIFSVSQLNRRAKQLLETHLPLIWVSGEISNLAKPSSGHWYFSLKDSQAQVRCAMFRNANQRVKWQLDSGQQVLIRARVSLYEGRGEYQLIAEHMEPAGAGALQQQYEALKDKLAAEGLFDSEQKLPLPAFPKHIGVITSPTGAAIHDILSVLKRRYPIASVTIFPVSVQGAQAAPEMITAIHKAQRVNTCDVVIIGRGGGSIEDLWAFNDEMLARTIAQCPIPIVSAVGHEVDFTIADFVADQRAPTPSVSAEMITPDISDWQQSLDHYQHCLLNHFKKLTHAQQQRLHFLRQRLRHPGERIRAQRQQLGLLKKSLAQTIQHSLNTSRSQLTQTQWRLSQFHPKKSITLHRNKIDLLSLKLQQNMNGIIKQNKQYFLQQVDVLHAISPLTVLSRGYSITRQKNGDIIKSHNDVDINDEVTTKLSDGYIISTIKTINS